MKHTRTKCRACAARGQPSRFGRWREWTNPFRSLHRNEGGTSALEFALVLPVLLLLLTGIIDASALFFIQNNMFNAAREAARALAVEEASEAEANASAQEKLLNWDATFTVTTQLPDPADPADTDVSVTITVPMSQVILIDVLGLSRTSIFKTGQLTSQITMRKE